MWFPRMLTIRVPRRSLEIIPGVLLLCISVALLWWSVPRLHEVFLDQGRLVPTTHISSGSDCEFGQKSRVEFDIDARAPTKFILVFRSIAPASSSHPCQYIYVRFPGRIDYAYADRLSGPLMAVESKEVIYERVPGYKPSLGNAFLDASLGDEARFTIVMNRLPERVRAGDIYIRGELTGFLSRSSFSDRILHYWIKLPKSRIRDGCETQSECEDDYLEDNPHLGVINLIFSGNLDIKSLLLAKSGEVLTRDGLTRITTEDLTGSVIAEDRDNARFRDVILLYAGALFATGIAVGADAIIELTRLALRGYL
jgi:hypothetical protein